MMETKCKFKTRVEACRDDHGYPQGRSVVSPKVPTEHAHNCAECNSDCPGGGR